MYYHLALTDRFVSEPAVELSQRKYRANQDAAFRYGSSPGELSLKERSKDQLGHYLSAVKETSRPGRSNMCCKATAIKDRERLSNCSSVDFSPFSKCHSQEKVRRNFPPCFEKGLASSK